MRSGSEVRCLIWCGNLFLSKRMRGACKWDIGLCLGLLLFCCHQVSLNLRLGSLQRQGREPLRPPPRTGVWGSLAAYTVKGSRLSISVSSPV